MNVPCSCANRPSMWLPRRPEVAVADREERLGHADVVERERVLDEAPRVDGEPVAIDHAASPGVGSVGVGGRESREIVDDDVGAGVAQLIRADAAIDADRRARSRRRRPTARR